MISRPRNRADAALAIATVTLLVIIVAGWGLAVLVAPDWFVKSFAVDYGIYMEAVDRWRATGAWYPDRQLHGPYPIEFGDVLYPPVLLYLLVPFRFLGPFLWVAIPTAILAVVVWYQRPALWAWFLIAICLAWPVTVAKFVFTNPVVWGAAAVGLGTIYRWPAAFVLVKLTVLPFALVGIWDRRWWLALCALALLSLPFLADTLRYPQVVLDAQTNPIDGRGGPLYSLQEYPLLVIPVLAWLGRRGRSWSPGSQRPSRFPGE